MVPVLTGIFIIRITVKKISPLRLVKTHQLVYVSEFNRNWLDKVALRQLLHI